MKKIVLVMLVFGLFVLAGCAENEIGEEEFCGSSTNSLCNSDSECKTSGCSGQICGGSDEQMISTCEWRECYDDEKYDVECKCADGKCKWLWK